MLRPRRLRPGARIAVVAPASPLPRESFDAGVAELARLGFAPVWDESVFARQRYVSGSPDLRADALRAALADPNIDAVIAVRGGYGSAQLLPLLDANEVIAAGKPIIGYSDITALLSFVTIQCGMVAFHGTMLDGRLAVGESAYDRDTFVRSLTVAEPLGEYQAPGLTTVVAGEAAGPILGGTVTQLLASLGTPWAFDPPRGYVLLFDEVGERPYRLDRMVTQLRQSGLLARASAVVIGELPKCDEPGSEGSAYDVVRELFAGFHGPVVIGFPAGHTAGPHLTVPLGVRARVIADHHTSRVVIEESAVS